MKKIYATKKEAQDAARAAWKLRGNKQTTEQTKQYLIKNRYGITLNQYKDMLKDQNNKCFICNEPKKLSIDHIHGTRTVRHLLCTSCNIKVGHLENALNPKKEKIKIFLKMLEYIGYK